MLLYKAGRTREGSAAASSHTAAAVGDYEVCEELARAAGAVVAASLDAFEDDVVAFTLLHDRAASGRRVAVLSNAGFEATAAADTLSGLELASLGSETRERLARLLPPGIVDVHNPVDATPVTPTRAYAAIAAALAEDAAVDALVVAGVPATPFLDSLATGPGHDEDVEGRPVSRRCSPRSSARPASRWCSRWTRARSTTRSPGRSREAGLPTFRRVDRATRALARFLGAARG